MNQAQAQQKALEVFGPEMEVTKDKNGTCLVKYKPTGEIAGIGPSWFAALKDAADRARAAQAEQARQEAQAFLLFLRDKHRDEFAEWVTAKVKEQEEYERKLREPAVLGPDGAAAVQPGEPAVLGPDGAAAVQPGEPAPLIVAP